MTTAATPPVCACDRTDGVHDLDCPATTTDHVQVEPAETEIPIGEEANAFKDASSDDGEGVARATVDGTEALIDRRLSPSQPELVQATLRHSLDALHEAQTKFDAIDEKFGKLKERHKEAQKSVETARSRVIEAAEREVAPEFTFDSAGPT